MKDLGLKKGDKVILKGFTGIKLGQFIITDTDPFFGYRIQKKDGTFLDFNLEGDQVNLEKGKERYACTIIPDDGSFRPSRKKGKND